MPTYSGRKFNEKNTKMVKNWLIDIFSPNVTPF